MAKVKIGKNHGIVVNDGYLEIGENSENGRVWNRNSQDAFTGHESLRFDEPLQLQADDSFSKKEIIDIGLNAAKVIATFL